MSRQHWVWAGFGALVFFLLLFKPANPLNYSRMEIVIPAGSSVRAAQEILINNHILPGRTPFLWMVKLLNLQNRIQAGEYSFSPSDPLPRVIVKLVFGETIPPMEITVTFPEGTSIYKMGIILKEEGYRDWQKFQALVKEGITPALRERHRALFRYIPSESLEGYLFPDTYKIAINSSVEVLAELLVGRFEEIVLPFWERNNNASKFGLHEVLTLASIIEKEAKLPGDRPLIASVFYNRLAAGVPLAADPTIKYALERPSKIVYLDQLSVRSPYNTYQRKGLPPGPICNPGLESIQAAVFPARTNYYFFVAKKDGSHLFSKTWQEHQRARSIPTR